MKNTITEPTQDYLKAIFELSQNDQAVSTNALAEKLNISPASVTGMVQRLAVFAPPLVVYRKHQGVTLTSEGERMALKVIRRHRLIETYLVQSLGYRWDEVHNEAEKLEHAISVDLESRIAKKLGDPRLDPHGEPIPSEDLIMPSDGTVSLNVLRPQQKARVKRVKADDPGFLRHAESIGLTPGTELKVVGFSSFDQNLSVKVWRQKPMILGESITSRIYVEVIQ